MEEKEIYLKPIGSEPRIGCVHTRRTFIWCVYLLRKLFLHELLGLFGA